METKRCKYCHDELPLTKEYFYFSKGKFDNRCKICRHILYLLNSDKKKETSRERYKKNREIILTQCSVYYESNREEILERKKKYTKRNKEKKRIYRLEKKFNITETELQNILDSQRGCCEICGDSLLYPDSVRSYAVDHNHETGEVRGLLCGNCNTALGLIKEDKRIAYSLIKYIEKYNV